VSALDVVRLRRVISYTRGDRTKEGLRVDLVDHPDNRVAQAGFVNP